MILAVNEAISALNASATASPTATVTMSPRMRKFLNPVNMLRTFPSRPRRLRAVEMRGGASRPAVDADHIVPARPESGNMVCRCLTPGIRIFGRCATRLNERRGWPVHDGAGHYPGGARRQE